MTEELEGQCAAMREELERLRKAEEERDALIEAAGEDSIAPLYAKKMLALSNCRHERDQLREELERCKRSLDNSSSLLTAMLHECRPVLEIEAQLIENRIVLSAMEASHE